MQIGKYKAGHHCVAAIVRFSAEKELNEISQTKQVDIAVKHNQVVGESANYNKSKSESSTQKQISLPLILGSCAMDTI